MEVDQIGFKPKKAIKKKDKVMSRAVYMEMKKAMKRSQKSK